MARSATAAPAASVIEVMLNFSANAGSAGAGGANTPAAASMMRMRTMVPSTEPATIRGILCSKKKFVAEKPARVDQREFRLAAQNYTKYAWSRVQRFHVFSRRGVKQSALWRRRPGSARTERGPRRSSGRGPPASGLQTRSGTLRKQRRRVHAAAGEERRASLTTVAIPTAPALGPSKRAASLSAAAQAACSSVRLVPLKRPRAAAQYVHVYWCRRRRASAPATAFGGHS